MSIGVAARIRSAVQNERARSWLLALIVTVFVLGAALAVPLAPSTVAPATSSRAADRQILAFIGRINSFGKGEPCPDNSEAFTLLHPMLWQGAGASTWVLGRAH
jgi:hypothetical protein